MTVTVKVTYERSEEDTYDDWDGGCGQAVTDALAGATAVVITDDHGAKFNVWAERIEDNS